MAKRYSVLIVCVLCILAFVCGSYVGYRGAVGRDSGGSSEHTGRVESLESTADLIGNGIAGAQSALVDAGRELAEGRPIVGEIGSGLDTIDRRSREAQKRIAHIEDACTRIEQAVEAIRKGE